MHPWALPSSFPAVPLLMHLESTLPLFRAGPACSPSFLPPRAGLGTLCLCCQGSISTAWAEWSLQQGLVKDAGGLLAVLFPSGPLPRCRGRTSWKTAPPSPELRESLYLPSIYSPAQTLSSLACPASVLCLLTPSTIFASLSVQEELRTQIFIAQSPNCQPASFPRLSPSFLTFKSPPPFPPKSMLQPPHLRSSLCITALCICCYHSGEKVLVPDPMGRGSQGLHLLHSFQA